jgi:NADH-quinone oxidoreductase subunit J
VVSQRGEAARSGRGLRLEAFGTARTVTGLAAAAFLALVAAPAWATSGGAAAAGPVVQPAAGSSLLEALMFYFIAATTVISVLGICVSKNIVRMAVWLFIALSWVSFLYFLLSAAFLGAIQLIVYVGGTLILLIFGVMLTSKSPWVRFEPRRWEWIGAGLVCVALLVTLCVILGRAVWADAGGPATGVGVADLGRRLLTTYLVPFEVAGVLLMIVMVGAAHLARQEKG